MIPRPVFRFFVSVLLLGFAALPALRAHGPGEEMADAAQHWLASLTTEQRVVGRFDLAAEERQNWNFVPLVRRGLTFKAMNPAQRLLAHALLASGLSARGLVKADTIMSLEGVLRELENGGVQVRDEELYYVTIFGTPAETGTWGWRVEGHHLSVNFTIINGHEISATPSFLGSNPAEVRSGPRQGLRVLADEEDLGRALVRSLTEAQRRTAVFQAQAPNEIITGNQRKVTALTPVGIAWPDLTAPQQAALLDLIREYLERARSEVARADLARITAAGVEKIRFGWAGSIEPRQAHYYRVQGPTFLLEYDNTQNGANHIHAAWRDFERDFGEDLLRAHYDHTPHPTATPPAAPVTAPAARP